MSMSDSFVVLVIIVVVVVGRCKIVRQVNSVSLLSDYPTN